MLLCVCVHESTFQLDRGQKTRAPGKTDVPVRPMASTAVPSFYLKTNCAKLSVMDKNIRETEYKQEEWTDEKPLYALLQAPLSIP